MNAYHSQGPIWFSKAFSSLCSKWHDTGFARTLSPALYSNCNELFHHKKNQKSFVKLLCGCGSKQECCINVKHITTVYLMIRFRSRCTCLLFEQLKSSHSPSFTSAVVFGSRVQLLTAVKSSCGFSFYWSRYCTSCNLSVIPRWTPQCISFRRENIVWSAMSF